MLGFTSAIVNDKGDTSTWSFEGGSPSATGSLGWAQDHPRVGETIEVGFRPMKDGSRGGQLMSVKFPSGQKVCLKPRLWRGTGDIVSRGRTGLNSEGVTMRILAFMVFALLLAARPVSAWEEYNTSTKAWRVQFPAKPQARKST